MTALPAVADRRAIVMQAVSAVPGSHLRSLQRITRLAWGTLRYHAEVLVQRGDVGTEMDRRFVRYYPREMPVQARRTWDALRTQPTRRILAALLDKPMAPRDVASLLRMPSSTAHRHLSRMRDLSLVHESAGLLLVRWPEPARLLLASVNPTYLDQLADGAIQLFDEL